MRLPEEQRLKQQLKLRTIDMKPYFLLLLLFLCGGALSCKPTNHISQPLQASPPPLPIPVDRTATLTWEAPTTNADGSPLLDLNSFKLYQFPPNQPTPITQLLAVTAKSCTLSDLQAGLHRFYITAIDKVGNESIKSNEVVKVIP